LGGAACIRRPSGTRQCGGFAFWGLQDRSGGSFVFLDQHLHKFLASCRRRPELEWGPRPILRFLPPYLLRCGCAIRMLKARRCPSPMSSLPNPAKPIWVGLREQFTLFAWQWRVYPPGRRGNSQSGPGYPHITPKQHQRHHGPALVTRQHAIISGADTPIASISPRPPIMAGPRLGTISGNPWPLSRRWRRTSGAANGLKRMG